MLWVRGCCGSTVKLWCLTILSVCKECVRYSGRDANTLDHTAERNRPKWVAGKVTGHVGNKMFTVQGPDGHCRRHEDQLKLRSVPKLNRQRRLSRPAPIDSARHTKTDQQRFDNCVQ